MSERDTHIIAAIWIYCGGSPVVAFHHYSSSFAHFSNHVKNIPFFFNGCSIQASCCHTGRYVWNTLSQPTEVLQFKPMTLNFNQGFLIYRSDVLAVYCIAYQLQHYMGFHLKAQEVTVIETGGHRCVNLSQSPFPPGWHIASWFQVSGGMHL